MPTHANIHAQKHNILSIVISTYPYFFFSSFISVSIQARDILLTHPSHQSGKSTLLSYSFSLCHPFPQLVACCPLPKTSLHYAVFCDFSKSFLILILTLYLRTGLLLFHFSPKKAKGNFVLKRDVVQGSVNQGLWVEFSSYPVFVQLMS